MTKTTSMCASTDSTLATLKLTFGPQVRKRGSLSELRRNKLLRDLVDDDGVVSLDVDYYDFARLGTAGT